MSAARRAVVLCVLLYAFTQAALLLDIESVGKHIFDERYYVPAAKQWTAFADSTNLEHPPLGKQLIGIGIALWGDRPLGWRFMSTVFGSLTVVGMFLWGTALFRSAGAGLVTALVTLGNQLLYVQSRVGMLDVFMVGFMVFALAAVTRAGDPSLPRPRVRRLLLFAGPIFGLATACKWTGAVAWALAAAAVVGAWLAARASVAARRSATDALPAEYTPRPFASLTADDLVAAFVVFPAAAYLMTFLPYLWVHRQPRYGLLDLLAMQKQIWDLQQQVTAPGSYASPWTAWPLMRRPVWYLFAFEPGRTAIQCVLFIGNPLVLWGGLAALAICVFDAIKRGSRTAAAIVICWATLYLSFALIPRRVGYFFYYYPAALTLSLAWVHVLRRWNDNLRIGPLRVRWLSAAFVAATFVFFFYFFDLLSGPLIGTEAFRSRMWFRSWY